MDDKTTTDAPVADGGQVIDGIAVDNQGQAIATTDEPQPEAPDTATAVEEPKQPSQEQPTEEEPQKDNSTQKWLEAKGIDPHSPEAIEKVAEMARNAEKAMHEKAQKASELEKSVNTQPEEIPADATPSEVENVRLRNIELKQSLQDWRITNPEKREFEGQMVKVLNSNPNVSAMVKEGYMDFNQLYAMAKGMDSSLEETVKSQGKKEALQTLAQQQQAAVPKGNAVNPSGSSSSTAITPQNVDQVAGSMSPEEYKRRLPEINRALAG